MVGLAEERQQFWSQLRQLAGLEIPMSIHDTVVNELESEFSRRAEAMKLEYETRIAELKSTLPAQIARRLANGLIRNAGSSAAVAELLASLPPVSVSSGNGAGTAASAVTSVPSPVTGPSQEPTPIAAVTPIASAAPAVSQLAAQPAASAVATAVADDDTIQLEAYIDSARCTSCNECTNLNNRMFAYNADKQAYVKDATAGTFQQLVLAAERCPVSIIHPGSPLNPKEKDLAKWIKRAEKFN
jgi:pyruvate-ferredoxin/flavodoxin oxidoreductase